MAGFTTKPVSLFLILSLILPSTLAAFYEVGGASGWKPGSDVQGWLTPLSINAGDTFHFKYDYPTSVAVVGQAGYLNCDASQAVETDSSGSYNFTFSDIGFTGFISAGPGECDGGLKLLVPVVAL